tara:strand:- start:221 stop:421 length:201 start_codon:yes stop_codon:yes gene_type:complete
MINMIFINFLAIGPLQIGLIVLAAILLFGTKRIPELMKGFGTGIKDFKKAIKEDKEEDKEDSSDSK